MKSTSTPPTKSHWQASYDLAKYLRKGRVSSQLLHLTRSDVSFSEFDQYVTLRLKHSKTDTQHCGCHDTQSCGRVVANAINDAHVGKWQSSVCFCIYRSWIQPCSFSLVYIQQVSPLLHMNIKRSTTYF